MLSLLGVYHLFEVYILLNKLECVIIDKIECLIEHGFEIGVP